MPYRIVKETEVKAGQVYELVGKKPPNHYGQSYKYIIITESSFHDISEWQHCLTFFYNYFDENKKEIGSNEIDGVQEDTLLDKKNI